MHLHETDSTNRWLRHHAAEGITAVWADYQTQGRGQGNNHWESERGQNLTCSLLLHPQGIHANRQFRISMAVALATLDTLQPYTGEGLSVKWPNDIYWRDSKLGGILIEHRLQGNSIQDTIAGIGINVNQLHFRSDAPNPVSLRQITGRETDRETLFRELQQRIHDRLQQDLNRDSLHSDLKARYMQVLYRRTGLHPYRDTQGTFQATIADVEDDGHLLLQDAQGHRRRYAFKEVAFVLPTTQTDQETTKP